MTRKAWGHDVWLHRDGELTVKWPGRGWVGLAQINRLGPHAWECVISETVSVWGRLPYVRKVGHTQQVVIQHAVSYAEIQNYLPPAKG